MAFSFYASLGKNKGFKLFEKDGPSIRIKLWHLSICITLIDIESIIKSLLEELEGKDNKEINFEKKIEEIGTEKETIKKLNKSIEDIKKEIEYKEKIYQERIKELIEKLERFDRREVNLREQIVALELESAGLRDVEDENEELNKYVEELEEKINYTQKTLEYLEIYFSLR